MAIRVLGVHRNVIQLNPNSTTTIMLVPESLILIDRRFLAHSLASYADFIIRLNHPRRVAIIEAGFISRSDRCSRASEV